MFGHDDTQQQQPADNSGMMQAAMPDPIADANTSQVPDPSPVFGAPVITPTEPSTPSTPAFSMPEPAASTTPEPAVSPSPETSAEEADLPTEQTGPAAQQTDNPLPASLGGSDDLMSLKQQAMQQLSPLVGHLDQTPEEKFRTTMMMIQASDDQSLIKTAYDAAQQISDDKARAQALLDVINEINYFTQHSASQS